MIEKLVFVGILGLGMMCIFIVISLYSVKSLQMLNYGIENINNIIKELIHRIEELNKKHQAPTIHKEDKSEQDKIYHIKRESKTKKGDFRTILLDKYLELKDKIPEKVVSLRSISYMFDTTSKTLQKGFKKSNIDISSKSLTMHDLVEFVIMNTLLDTSELIDDPEKVAEEYIMNIANEKEKFIKRATISHLVKLTPDSACTITRDIVRDYQAGKRLPKIPLVNVSHIYLVPVSLFKRTRYYATRSREE